MSFLGIDIGEKRIGIAIGSFIAEEHSTITVKPPAHSFLDNKLGTQQAIEQLKRIADEERIEKIAAGIPINEDGSHSSQTGKVINFISALENAVEIPVEKVNEILTTFAAQDILKEEGLTIEESKERIDQVSAKLILQQFIEEQ